jgi:galactose oxidase-like protein/Kelch motif protein
MKSRRKKPRTQRRSIGIARLAGILITILFDLSAWAQPPGTLTEVGDLPFPERNAVPILLLSNSVLIVGGIGISSRLTSVIQYDPSSTTFSTGGDMDAPYDTATLLADGRILLAGRGAFVSLGTNGTVQTTAELYDPTSGTFSSAGPTIDSFSSAAAVRLSDGRVLFTGGRIATQANAPTAAAEIYSPESGTFTITGSMTTPRYNHTATLLQNGQVLIAGGTSTKTGSPLSSAELYDSSRGVFVSLGNMITAHSNHTATLLEDGRVLIAGGSSQPSTAKGSVTSHAELYDPSSETFTSTSAMQTPREFHTAVRLTDGAVLVAGGDNAKTILSSMELYDPANGAFIPAAAMTVPRENLSATLLSDGNGFIAGGLTTLTEGATTEGAELYVP